VSRIKTDGDEKKVVINNLFYKKSGKSKTLVALQNDSDIPAMLKEYPLTWPGSGKKRKCTLVIGVNWSYKDGELFYFSLFF